MHPDEKDPFAHRSQGGHFNVGSGDGDNMSALVKVDNQLMCITRKNIRVVLMADTVDPNRTNPNINHNIQQILPYGSDSEFVGKTLQQASILFKEHILPANIDHNMGVSISLSFLKEITALDKLRNEYVEQEENINSSAKKRAHVPTFPNLEQKVKGFILNTDHAMRSIMELAQLFYPNIKNKGWEHQLYEIIKSELGEQDPFTSFVADFKKFTERTRKIRNAIEHPDSENILTIENYKLTPANIVELPSFSFMGKEYTQPKVTVPVFMDSTVHNLLTVFEFLMAYLCNLHVEPFAGSKRVVVSVSEDKRQESEKHVNFQYHIHWIK